MKRLCARSSFKGLLSSSSCPLPGSRFRTGSCVWVDLRRIPLYFEPISIVIFPCGSLGASCEQSLKMIFGCPHSSKGAPNFRRIYDVLLGRCKIIPLFNRSVLAHYPYYLMIFLSYWDCSMFTCDWYVLFFLSFLEVGEDIKVC